VDTIVHLAGMNAPEAETDPERAMMERSLLTLRLVNASIAAGIKRFIYISSAKVYGLNLTGMVDEDTPVRPINHYAITHHTAESYILAAHNKKVFDGIVLRLSNGLGVPVTPDVDCWGIIANDFCKQAVETRCIEMTGTGEAKRNFIPMSGVVDTLCFALDVPRDVIKDGLFNLGGASAMKIIELAKLISNRCERLFGFKPEILHAAHTPGEVYPELNYTSKKLVDSGFAPQSDITQEIDDILRLCKVNLATTSNVEI
ncbi:MAG: SDR family oxidoreductase, partial [Rhodospirillales bacterium]|nr:SDR family oxidoreductase [Rhodospirillales bacterium]